MSITDQFQSALESYQDLSNAVTSIAKTATNSRKLDTRNPGLDQTRYDFNYRVFPEDLSADYNSHYMVININVPVNYSGGVRGSYYGTVTGEGGRFTTTPLDREYSKVDNLRFNSGSSPVTGPNVPGDVATGEFYTPQRNTRRIAESIALYMPSPVIYNQLNMYEDISMTAFMGQAGKILGTPAAQYAASAASAYMNRTINSGRRGASAVGSIGDGLGNFIGTGMQLAGFPINPRIEVLFANTLQRQFNFEFLMAPRSEKESETIKNIIRTLRFHAAPEISNIAIVPTFIPPAEFDITFYAGGTENMNIPRINTCALERCEVDYAPSGMWSTFSNGHPVAVRMSLAFRELEIVHKRRVVQGF